MLPQRFYPLPLDRLLLGEPYGPRFTQRLGEIHPGLADQLISATVSAITPDVADAAIALALTFACQAQSSANIDLGRATLLALPHAEVSRRIKSVAARTLNPGDAWEMRRLLEAVGLLDLEMLREIADDLMASPDAEIREAAVEVLELAETG